MMLDSEIVVRSAREVGIDRHSTLAQVSGVDSKRLQKAIGGRAELVPLEILALARALNREPLEIVSCPIPSSLILNLFN
ncbi:hypothetical protein [Desulfoferula mesophila]|uniref:HTH cro/C1-type domain-containing protein n=1 Tax=Desulfoferula mesophila TaxID=3058419 RepID=A0AAU9EIQ4_9BACT|nr:hypothetical protein FAK_15600 [Desulfoferula mesophilus]